tara:strand:+ start:9249 stop:9410 length:162 start_codon:yes stop_codon:yes gene_type:complete
MISEVIIFATLVLFLISHLKTKPMENPKIKFIDLLKLFALIFFGLWFVINMGA